MLSRCLLRVNPFIRITGALDIGLVLDCDRGLQLMMLFARNLSLYAPQ